MHSLKSQSTTLGMPQQNNPIAIWAKKLTKVVSFFSICVYFMYCQGLCKKQVVLFTQALHVHVNSKKIKSKTSASFRSIHYRTAL